MKLMIAAKFFYIHDFVCIYQTMHCNAKNADEYNIENNDNPLNRVISLEQYITSKLSYAQTKSPSQY